MTRIRAAAPEDADALAELRAALWPEGSLEEHRAEARSLLDGFPPGSLPTAVFVAEQGQALIGFAEVGLRSHADGCDPRRPCGFLEGWYVKPELTRRGVGRALVERCEQWAARMGCTELGSDTWEDNTESQGAHLAVGFEIVDRCVNFRKSIGPSPAFESRGPFYGLELARLHHERFGWLAEAAAEELLNRLAACRVTNGTVVDLATGSGILARRVLEAGFDPVGVDVSRDMLHLARSHAPGGRFVLGSLWEFDIPSCVAVAAVGEAFNYATGSHRPDRVALERRFGSIARSLSPGGLLLFDVAGPGRSGAEGSRKTSREFDRAVLLIDEREEADRSRLTRRISTFAGSGTIYRRSDETHELTLFDPEEVVAALERSGFAVERLETYGRLPPIPGWHRFAATRMGG